MPCLRFPMPRGRFSGLLLAGALGCASMDTAAGPAAWMPVAPPPWQPPALQTERFVLVRAGSTLYVSPSLEAAHAGDSGEGDRGAPVVYRLLGESGPWLEVLTVPENDRRHCAQADPRFRGLALRLFVDRSDVVTVTTRPVLRQYPDGTGVYLTEGAPLGPPQPYPWTNGFDVRTIEVDRLAFDLDIPRSSTGTSYVLGPRHDQHETTEVVAQRAPLAFGGTGRITVLGNPSVYGSWPEADGALIEIRGRCSVLRAMGARTAVVPAAPAPQDEPRRPLADLWRVRKGATVYWPSGFPAGSTTAAVDLARTGRAIGPRTCFAKRLASAEPTRGTSLLLCFDAEDLVATPAAQPDVQASQLGPTGRVYVALEIANQTPRSTDEIEPVVRATAKNALLDAGGWAMAPPGEPEAQVVATARANGVRALRIRIEIAPVVRSGGVVSQVIRARAESLTDEAAPREAERRAKVTAPPGDVAKHDALIRSSVAAALAELKRSVEGAQAAH